VQPHFLLSGLSDEEVKERWQEAGARHGAEISNHTVYVESKEFLDARFFTEGRLQELIVPALWSALEQAAADGNASCEALRGLCRRYLATAGVERNNFDVARDVYLFRESC